MAEPVIDVSIDRVWQNWHSSSNVGGKVERFLTPHNAFTDGSTVAGKGFAAGLAGLQKIVRDAEAAGKRVRALGSAWSLSSCAYVEDHLVNTQRLTYWFMGFKTPTYVEPTMRADASRLVFSQCGVQIKTLNTYLEANGFALPTSGASNGQTIAGAMSTGTHGSAHTVGSIQDYILGLHVVGEGGEHYWIERKSRPVMTKEFAETWLGAKLRREDDDLFRAAVVSFGSFGLIHAVMFRAEPLYTLELYTENLDYDDVMTAAFTMDISNLKLPRGTEMPFHFEVVLNPYFPARGQKGAFLRVMYKDTLKGPPPTPSPTSGNMLRSRDLVSIAGLFSDAAPAIVPGLLQDQLMDAIAPTAPGTSIATPGIQFGDSQPTNGGTSIEIGVPLSECSQAVQVILDVARKKPFGAPLALRYLKASDAFLAFTYHQPITVALEMPGIDSQTAAHAHAAIFQGLLDAALTPTYHWGQRGLYQTDPIRAGYTYDRVEKWLAARRSFLTPAGRRTFSNAMLEACGLAD